MSTTWRMASVEDVDRIKAQALLLDVRTPAEFEAAHIPGSISHPIDSLDPTQVRHLAEGRMSCVLICRSGGRAARAAEALHAAGLSGLTVLEGGVSAWEAARREVRRGRQTISLERQVRIGAGALVLTGVILGFAIHPGFFGLSGFVGAGLVFAGITDWCGLGLLLAKMPWNRR